MKREMVQTDFGEVTVRWWDKFSDGGEGILQLDPIGRSPLHMAMIDSQRDDEAEERLP